MAAAAVEQASSLTHLTPSAHQNTDQEDSQNLSRYNSPEAIQPIPSNASNNDNDLLQAEPDSSEVLNTSQAKRSGSPRPGLPPVRTPLAIMPSYIRQSSTETTLTMTRKIHDQYTVKTTTDPKEPIFHIDVHHGLFPHQKTRTIYDAKLSIALLELQDRRNTKTMSLRVSVKRPSPDGSKAMEVGEEKRGGFVGDFENHAVGLCARLIGGDDGGMSSIYVRSDDKEEGWKMVGQSTIRSRMGNQIVATVKRSDDLSNLEYTVTIALGVDMSLIVAFCMAMDHKWSKEKRWTGEHRADST